jgi:hypothetical protein
MGDDVSKRCGSERDLLCGGPVACLLWCAPWFVFAFGFRASPGLRMILWSTSLAVVGVACLLNASRCGRVHCRFAGPFFILASVAVLACGLGFLPLGPSGWNWIGGGIIVGALGLTFIPELFLGRYRQKGSEPNQSMKPKRCKF